MRVSRVVSYALLLLSGVSMSALAAGDYFPPERIHCHLNKAGTMNCDGFSRQYLQEDTHTANLPEGKDISFFFSSGVAYFTADESETSIFFTYRDPSGKFVKLKTVNNTIKPDTAAGAWKRYKDEYYTCNTSYMNCPITNLPSHQR